jgi:tetratricopeptide (TPR) repeat protein
VLVAVSLVVIAVGPARADRPRGMTLATSSGSTAEPQSAWAEYTVGVFLMETGAVLRAADHLENAWRLSNHDVEIGRKLAEAYLRLKNFTRCEMVADEILVQREDDYEALLLKAKVRFVKRDRATAVKLLEKIREAHGPHFEVERLLGNIAYEDGDIEKALSAYHNCIQVENSHPYIHYRYGTLLAQSFRFTEAEKAFLRAIELDPGFVEPALELADMYTNTGRPHDAVPVLENVVSIDPSNMEAIIALAQIHLQTGRFDDGIRLLEERRSLGPLPREAGILLGRLYYEAGVYDEAFVVFESILEQEKNNPELARILGEISLRAGDPERSLRYFDMAIEMDESDYRSYIGKFFAASPNFNEDEVIIDLTLEERVELLARASSLVKGFDFEGNYLLGVSYLSLDSLETAKTHLLRANEIKRDDRGALLNLASVFEKREEYEDAEKYLSRLYELDPDDATICNFYGYLLAQMQKDLEKAEKLVLKALEAEPENGYYLDSLGWVYYQMGDYPRAIVELEKAALRVSDDPIVLEHLGDAYRAVRRFEEARTAYERSSRLQDGNAEIIEKIQSTEPDTD